VARVILKANRKPRIEAGHPWVFASEIESAQGSYAGGDIVEVANHSGRFIGKGYINDASAITVRLLTNQDEEIDERFFRSRIEKAIRYREMVVKDTDSYRLINAEADFLPALIVDRYANYLVVQILSLGMERWKETIVRLLIELVQPAGIYERSDVPVRRLEGLEEKKGFLKGPFDTKVTATIDGVSLRADVAEGQKTGLFLDQRENYRALESLSTGREVLNCFSYVGGFGLFALSYGAGSVLHIDISERAIEGARENSARNDFEMRSAFRTGNAFDELRGIVESGRRFDMVVLDPPAFVKDRKSLNSALGGYKEINLRGMKLLREGGVLVTCSCSHHLRRDEFEEMLRSAAYDAKRKVRLIKALSQASDHPTLLAAKETDYLKCLILEVI